MSGKTDYTNCQIDDSVWCPKCDVLMTWQEYREHAKKEFGKTHEYSKCCNSENLDYDRNGRLRCGDCWKFCKTYKKFIEYIVPERRMK